MHELGHALGLSAQYVIPGFQQDLQDAFKAAKADGKWHQTYAGSKVTECLVSL